MKPVAFVLMPFDQEFEDVYRDFISDVLVGVGFEVRRADDLVNQQNILKDIISEIAQCDLIVTDLTSSNPNVYYELGIAHALRKPTVLLVQDIDELPFDLRQYRVIPYGVHFSIMKKAQAEFETFARAALGGTVKFSSPFTDFAVESKASILLGGRSREPREVKKPKDGEADESEQEDEEEGEAGFLDFLVEMEEGFQELTELAGQVSTETEAIGAATTRTSKDLKRAGENPSKGTASFKRKVVRKLAEQLKRYGLLLNTVNDRYRQTLVKIANGLDFIVEYPAVSKENSDGLGEFLDTLGRTQESATGALESMRVFRDTMEGLPSVEKRFNRSKQVTVLELDSFLKNVEQTVALISRARTDGYRRLESLEPSNEN